MNRIEEIKERNERRKALMNDRKDEFVMIKEVEYQGLVKISVEDVQYLLSKLEIAEKALEDIRFKAQVVASHCALQKDRCENVQADYAFEKTQAIYEGIDMVIKQIQE